MADEHRERGNAALRGGDFAGAEAAYTAALASTSERTGLGLAQLRHNRAIARLRQSNYAGALADANSALAADSLLVKAYSTKGTALLNLSRLEEAAEAYGAGLALDAAHVGCRDGAAAAAAAMRAAADRDEGLFPPSAPAEPEPAAGGGWAAGAVRVARVVLLAGVAYHLVGVPRERSGRSYLAVLVLAALVHAGATAARHGVPGLSTWRAWLERVATDAGAPSLLLPVAFLSLSGSGAFLPVLAATVVDVWYALEFVARAPVLGRALGAAGAAALPSLLSLPAAAAAALTPARRRAAVLARLLEVSATATLAQLLYSLVLLATPRRNIMALLLLGQLVQMLFLFSPPTRRVLAAAHALARRATAHRWCPDAVRTGYAAAAGAAYEAAVSSLRAARARAEGRADAEGEGAGAGGGVTGAAMRAARTVAGRCDIM